MRSFTDPIPADKLLWRLRMATWSFVVGLVLSGLTAIPILSQFEWARVWLGPGFRSPWLPVEISNWLQRVDLGIHAADQAAPFIWYGTDWLAFGHVAIALAFVGALRDPVERR